MGLTMKKTLREAADLIMEQSSQMFMKDGKLDLIFLVDEDGELKAIMFQGGMPKNIMGAFLRDNFGKAERIFTTGEMWMSTMSDQRPSKAPDRVECVMVTAEDNTGQQFLLYRRIVRDGGKVSLEKVEISDHCGGGNFGDILKPAGPKH